MPLAIANDLTIHYQEFGDGTPVVMIHGLLLGNLASWYLTVAPALARSHRVLLYDLRGHGLSERSPRGYDLATMSGDLGVLCQRLLPAPVALVGHSWGGLVALRFAIDHPRLVSRLAVIDAPLPPSRAEDFVRLAENPLALLDALPAGLRRQWSGQSRRRSRLLDTIRGLVEETSLTDDVAAEPDFGDADLAGLACPVLCVYGDRSSCRPAADRLSSTIPGARVVVLPGGHWLPFDSPDPLARCLAGFLDE